MNAINNIINQYKDISVESSYNGLKLIIPYYHDDGDMYELFIKEIGDNKFLIHDNGLTLMRLSYYLDLTDKRIQVLNRILTENYINNNNGDINIQTDEEHFIASLNQICMTISKITNMKILSKEMVSSMFYEYIDEYVTRELIPHYEVIRNYKPNDIDYFPTSYKIKTKKPIYLFPIKENSSALRAALGCNQLKLTKESHSSVGVCENLDDINKMDKYFLMTALDKTYPQFKNFKESFPEFIERFSA